MNNPFTEYLILLDHMREALCQLSELARQKTRAVQNNDLAALDEVLKQEQASALAFRGLEQKKTALLNSTGLNGVPLSSLAENYPPKMRLEAKQTVEKLQAQYQVYRSSSEVARTTLECNLHEIDKIVGSAADAQDGAGYSPKEPQLPKPMKTDFRA